MRFCQEQRFALTSGSGVKASGRRPWGSNGMLIGTQGRQFGGDPIRRVHHIVKMVFHGDRVFYRVVEPGIAEGAFAMHFQIADKGIPITDVSPTGIGDQVNALQAKCSRNQVGSNRTVGL